MEVIGLPAIPGFASGNWRLERSQDVAVNPFGRTRHRTEFDGYVWRCALTCPKYNDEDAAVMEAWLDQVSEADHQLYVSPPQNQLRGAWATPELVSNGTFAGGVTTGWTGTGATLSVNARRLKVKNSGAAIGYARQSLAVTADVPYVLLVDLYAGSTKNWRLRLLDGADVEEHVSYYDQAGRVPIVHIPGSTTLKLELGCNTAVAGDDVKFGGVRMARCLLIDDSLAVGNELKVKGGPPSVDGAIKAGQFVTVRLWNGSQLMRLIEDLDTDASGKGTLKFGTALRAGVLGGGPVIIHAPFMRATLDAPVSESQLEAPNFKGFAVDAIEDPGALDDEVPHDTDIIWHWDANSLALEPTIGAGTPSVTSDADDNYYFDSDGVLKKAVANSAVFEFNPVTKALYGARFHGARTNLVWPSEDFTHANWVKTEASISANGLAAPDGTVTMDYFIPSANALAHYMQMVVSSTTNACVAGLFVKVDSSIDRVTFFPGGTSTFAHFNLETLTATKEANVTANRIVDCGDGVYWLQAEWPAGQNHDRLRVYASSGTFGSDLVAGDGVSGIWMWGGQYHDNNPIINSYIRSITASVALAADVASVPTSAIIKYNASALSMVLEAIAAPAAHFNQYTASLVGNSGQDIVCFRRPGVGAWFIFDDSVAQADRTAAVANGALWRAAGAAAANDFYASFDGGAVTTDNAGTMPLDTSLLYLGSNGSQFSDGYLRRLTLFKAKKPPRQIRSLAA